ncbi:MAG: YbaB/EbfC family nucleoid-associated protein [Patescibacteria group bacterium]
MFDKLGQLKDLAKMRSEAMKLQKELELITETIDHKGVKVKVTASNKVVYIESNGKTDAAVAEAINEAFKKVQKEAAKKMMEMGGGLQGLLGR